MSRESYRKNLYIYIEGLNFVSDRRGTDVLSEITLKGPEGSGSETGRRTGRVGEVGLETDGTSNVGKD